MQSVAGKSVAEVERAPVASLAPIATPPFVARQEEVESAQSHCRKVGRGTRATAPKGTGSLAKGGGVMSLPLPQAYRAQCF